MEQIDDTVKRIIGDHLGILGSTLSLDTHITDDLGADSLDRIELIITIEERFGIKMEEQVIANIQRVGDIVAHVQRILDGQVK